MSDTPPPPPPPSTPPPPPPPSAPPPPPGAAAGVGSVETSSFSPWINRVGAYLLRSLALVPVFIPFVIVGALLGDIGWLLMLVGYAVMIAAGIRFIIQRAHLGYDVGDRIVGQRLVREGTGQPMGSGWSVFWRSVAHILDSLPCYLGFLWPLWDSKKQTFADKVVSTVVVSDEASSRHEAKDLWLNAVMFWTPVTRQ